MSTLMTEILVWVTAVLCLIQAVFVIDLILKMNNTTTLTEQIGRSIWRIWSPVASVLTSGLHFCQRLLSSNQTSTDHQLPDPDTTGEYNPSSDVPTWDDIWEADDLSEEEADRILAEDGLLTDQMVSDNTSLLEEGDTPPLLEPADHDNTDDATAIALNDDWEEVIQQGPDPLPASEPPLLCLGRHLGTTSFDLDPPMNTEAFDDLYQAWLDGLVEFTFEGSFQRDLPWHAETKGGETIYKCRVMVQDEARERIWTIRVLKIQGNNRAKLLFAVTPESLDQHVQSGWQVEYKVPTKRRAHRWNEEISRVLTLYQDARQVTKLRTGLEDGTFEGEG